MKVFIGDHVNPIRVEHGVGSTLVYAPGVVAIGLHLDTMITAVVMPGPGLSHTDVDIRAAIVA